MGRRRGAVRAGGSTRVLAAAGVQPIVGVVVAAQVVRVNGGRGHRRLRRLPAVFGEAARIRRRRTRVRVRGVVGDRRRGGARLADWRDSDVEWPVSVATGQGPALAHLLSFGVALVVVLVRQVRDARVIRLEISAAHQHHLVAHRPTNAVLPEKLNLRPATENGARY